MTSFKRRRVFRAVAAAFFCGTAAALLFSYRRVRWEWDRPAEAVVKVRTDEADVANICRRVIGELQRNGVRF